MQSPPPEKDQRARVSAITVLAAPGEASQQAFDTGVAIAEGQAIAKRLGQMPGNVCTPETFAEVGREIADRHGMQLTVWGREQLAAANMGSFLSVAQGTSQDPKLVALEHRGGPAGQQPVVLIGKGSASIQAGSRSSPRQRWSG